MRTRKLGRLLGSAALVLLLAGCFKVNMDVEITPENTVSGSAVIAVDESLLELSGQSADQLFADMDLSDLPPGATSGSYEEDGFVGQRITFEDVPLDEFTAENALSGSQGGDDLSIQRRGDEFHVSGAFDMSGEEFSGTDIPQQFLESFEFRISITFPGEVKSATGEVDGNTVTWEPAIGENTPVEAVASAIPSASSPLLLILLVAGGAVALGAVAYILTHRKTAAPAAPVDSGFGTPIESPPPMAEGSAGAFPPVEPPPSAPPPKERPSPPPKPPSGTP